MKSHFKKTWGQRLATTLLLAYLALLGLLFVFQRNFLYFPNGAYRAPPTPFEEAAVTTKDGLSLKGWLCPAREGKKTVVFFHGNADTLENSARVALPYCAAGFGFLATEYRGYSGFAGKPTEQGLYADARAFTDALLARSVPEKDIVFFGHSLGTGVATQMAVEFPQAGGLILLSPFLSVPDMAQVHYPVFPSRYLARDKFANDEKIQDLRMPVLIAHGTADRIIPFTQGEKLAGLARAPKTFLPVEGGGHNDLFGEPFTSESLRWMERL